MNRVARLHILVLRDSLLDADAEVDADRRAIEADVERLREDCARRDDLQRQLARAIEDAEAAA
jgi:hypothetical protein